MYIPKQRLEKRSFTPYSYIPIVFIGVFILLLLARFLYYRNSSQLTPTPRPPRIRQPANRNNDVELANPPPPYQPDKLPAYEEMNGDNVGNPSGEIGDQSGDDILSEGGSRSRDNRTENENEDTNQEGTAPGESLGEETQNEVAENTMSDSREPETELPSSSSDSRGRIESLDNNETHDNEFRDGNTTTRTADANNANGADRSNTILIPTIVRPSVAMTRETRS